MNRFKNARDIQAGASNPVAIINVLKDAVVEARAENADPAKDPAVYLILHQLAWVLIGKDIGDERFSPAYNQVLDHCEAEERLLAGLLQKQVEASPAPESTP